MSDSGYTPTDGEMRIYFAQDDRGYRDEQDLRTFDSWLAAHDAEVRADQIRKDAEIVKEEGDVLEHTGLSVRNAAWAFARKIVGQIGENK